MRRVVITLSLLVGLLTGGMPTQAPALAASRVYDGLRVAQALQGGVVKVQPAQSLKSAEMIVRELEVANKLPPDVVKEVAVKQEKGFNAYTDGQNIYVTEALWDALRTNDQRAFVLGHELSHIVLQHIQKTQVRRVGLSLLDRLLQNRFGRENAVWSVAQGVGIGLIDKRFSRDVEYQADDLGLQLTSKAGYDPNAAIQVFNILQQNSGSGGLEFLRSHPLSESRIRALAKKHQLKLSN